MACCNPDFLVHFRPKKYTYFYDNPITRIACRYCLNCRKDWQNEWSDRAKYEYKKRLTASFVTLTYNDYELAEKMYHSPVDNSLQCSLDYSDIRKFVNRTRQYLRDHDINNVLAQRDFSYIYVGEYGENGSVFDRCHFHILFFGLDFAYCKKIFEKEWKYGFIDVLPLLDGGINYVLEYMDKVPKGEVAHLKYDIHLLARPKSYASKSFGASLFYDNVQDIKNHDYTYKAGKVRRPINPYYKQKIFGDDYQRDRNLKFLSAKRIRNEMTTTYQLRNTAKQFYAFKKRQSELRERKLRQKILNSGVGVLDYLQDNSLYYSPNRERLKTLSDSTCRWLVSEYINSVCKEVG